MSRTMSSALLPSHKRNHSNQIPVIQHICTNPYHIQLSLFSSFDLKSLPYIVAVQEPFLVNGSPPRVPNYQLIFPLFLLCIKSLFAFIFFPLLLILSLLFNYFLTVVIFAPLLLHFLKRSSSTTSPRCQSTTCTIAKNSARPDQLPPSKLLRNPLYPLWY
jgi:hypothetical protein